MNKKEIKAISLGIIVLFIGISLSTGQSMMKTTQASTHQTVIPPTDDSTIWVNSTPDGDGNLMIVRNNFAQGGEGGFEYDALIKFNTSFIPSDATIISASLNLYYNDHGYTNPIGRTYNLHRALNDWNEETVDWANQPAWENQSTCNSTVPTSPGVWMTWDVTNDVQGFVNGIIHNYGWKISDDTYWGQPNLPASTFRTKEYGNNTTIPYLNVTYDLPPETPIINGPVNGKAGVSYNYNFVTTDPDGDNVYYFINWGDNTTYGWLGPYSSGQSCIVSHTFSKKGTYIIKAKAKDIYGAESGWGTLTVTMPLSYEPPHFRFLYWLLERFPHTFPILRHLFGY